MAGLFGILGMWRGSSGGERLQASAPSGNGKLREWTFADLRAGDTVRFATGPLAGQLEFGYLFTPGRCRFCKLHDADRTGQASLMERDGNGPVQAELDGVFEMRLCGAHFEAHWIRRKADRGQLTVITDDEALAALMEPPNLAQFDLPTASERTLQVRVIDHSYLLWGVAADIVEDWTRLTSARIGEIWVPFPAQNGGRLALTAREYFATFKAGNVAFVRERLTGFRHVKAKNGQERGKADERKVPESV